MCLEQNEPGCDGGEIHAETQGAPSHMTLRPGGTFIRYAREATGVFSVEKQHGGTGVSAVSLKNAYFRNRVN